MTGSTHRVELRIDKLLLPSHPAADKTEVAHPIPAAG